MLTDKKLARERAANPKTFITQRLSSDSLFHIATHKYQGGEYTPVDYLMNPFWLWCSQCIPNTLLKKGTKGDGSDDFVNSSMKSGKNRTNILQKLPLTSEYGNLNYFNLSSTDSSVYSTINRDNIQSMKFVLSDNDNNIVNLNGGELSFTLAFQY